MLGRIAHTGIKQHLQAACLRSLALARGVHRRESDLDRPIFIVGCGRSGTTIFGRSLGQHEAVGYLNEPGLLWKAAFPRSDIWSRFAPRLDGSLVLDETDWNEGDANLLRFFFRQVLTRSGTNRLCEKTPGNEFRLRLLAKTFPDARYIWLVRQPLDVAKSIQRQADAATAGFGWYGFQNYKWRQLQAVSRKCVSYNHLPSLCKDNFDRGLVEWLLSTHAAHAFFSRRPQLAVLRVCYEEFAKEPVAVLQNVCDFAELPTSRGLFGWAERHVNHANSWATRARHEPCRNGSPCPVVP